MIISKDIRTKLPRKPLRNPRLVNYPYVVAYEFDGIVWDADCVQQMGRFEILDQFKRDHSIMSIEIFAFWVDYLVNSDNAEYSPNYYVSWAKEYMTRCLVYNWQDKTDSAFHYWAVSHPEYSIPRCKRIMVTK